MAQSGPGNHRGTIAAVDHLIEHGHTRIGFVGNLAQRDIRDRFVAYQQSLKSHGLIEDPTLMFSAPENSETGGAIAAHAVLNAQHRPTALMVATDRNAMGLMRTLTSAGVEIPRDIAIVAFDNIAAGTFSTPTLSSVDQGFDEVGALAGVLIVEKIRGEDVSSTAFTAEPGALILRESCGCEFDAQHATNPVGDALTIASAERLREGLRDVLQRELFTGDEVVDSRSMEAIETSVTHTMRLLDLGETATPPRSRLLWPPCSSSPVALTRYGDSRMR